MAENRHLAHLNLTGNQLLNALMHPVATDVVSPADGQVWYNTAEGRLKVRVGGTTKPLALLEDVTAGSVTGALWDAQSVVVAVADDTPAAVVIPEDAFVGRIATGNIGAVSAAQAKTMLGIPAGSVANEAYVTAQIDALVNGAPGALDTLNELATALTDNDSDIAAINSALAARTQKYAESIGDGAATTYTVTHSLGTTDVTFAMFPVAGGPAVLVDWEPVSPSAVEVRFNVAPTAAQYRVVVVG